jgi:hypothetical protein
MPTIMLNELRAELDPLLDMIRNGELMSPDDFLAFMIYGPPGCGKSRVPMTWFKYGEVITIPELLEDDVTARALIEAQIKRLCIEEVERLVKWANENPYRPCLLMLDELPQGSTNVAKVMAKWIDVREVAGIKLPNNVVIMATGNEKKHRSATQSMPAHLTSRMLSVFTIPDVDGWLDWGATILHEDILAYIHMKPTASFSWCDNVTDEALSQQYRDATDGTPHPCFRTYAKLSSALKRNPKMSTAMMAGLIGPERASEFQAMRNVKIPTHPDLLEGRADWPSNPMARWVAAIRCGQMLTPGNARKTAKALKNINPELVEVALKVAGKVALNYLRTKGLKVANGHMALVSCDSNGAYYYPGFSEELLAPGSRYLAMQEAT